MALVKSLSGNHSRVFGLGSVCSLGRKRVLVRSQSSVSPSTSSIYSSDNIASDFNFKFDSELESDSPLKRRCTGEGRQEEPGSSVRTEEGEAKSLLESMPQEILIKIICGVNHDDLEQLFHVSTSIREAATIAKKYHFAYSTPSKIKAFRNSIDLDGNRLSEEDDDYEEAAAPDAPKQSRVPRSRLNRKKLSDISVKLFDEEEEGLLSPKF